MLISESALLCRASQLLQWSFPGQFPLNGHEPPRCVVFALQLSQGDIVECLV